MKLFRSVRFNITLFALVALASALGTFLPQRHEAPANVEEFLAAHPAAGRAMDAMGLFNLFHSSWYVALLGLMAFDVVACKLRALPRDPHEEERLSERLVAAAPLHETFTLAVPVEDAAAALREQLLAQGYGVRVWRGAGEAHLWAVKHRFQRWGDFLLHLSVVAILVGALYGSLRGFEEFLPIPAGGVKSMLNRPWTVAVDEFIVDFYKETGAARTFASQVRVADRGREVARKRVAVNDPLDIGGVRFYQASWGMTGMLTAATLEVPRRGAEPLRIRVPRGRRVPLEGTGLEVAVDLVLPDFIVNAAGQADTRGLEPDNPAVRVAFFRDEERAAVLWLLQRRPELAFKVLPDQTVAPAEKPPFRLGGFEPVLFAGIQVAYDPGVAVVGWGCVALLAGLAIHFYLHQRRLRVLLTPGDGGARARVGGWSSRGSDDYDAEFRALFDGLTARSPDG